MRGEVFILKIAFDFVDIVLNCNCVCKNKNKVVPILISLHDSSSDFFCEPIARLKKTSL